MDTPLLLLWTWLLMGASLQDSVHVSPDMSQFFRGSQLTLRCDDGTWDLLWNTSRGSRRRCGQDGYFISGPWCKVKYLEVADSGQYWCESRGGATSDPIHITVTDRGVVLQMPVRPVASGQSVSLICRHHSTAGLPARFYRDRNLLSEEPAGHMTIQQVALSDEGQYHCQIKGDHSAPVELRVLADRDVVLQMPVLPVASGQSVSLICRHPSYSGLPARFYKDGNFLSEEPSGHMTIQQVALSDKGQYHCQIKGDRSAPVELRVLAGSSSDPLNSNSTAAPSPSSTSPLLVPMVASAVGLVLLILLVLTVLLVRRCRRQKTKGSRAKRRRTQTPQTPQTNVSRVKSKNKKQPKICQKCQNSFSP